MTHALTLKDGRELLGGMVIASNAAVVEIDIYRLGRRTVPAAMVAAAGLSSSPGSPIAALVAADGITVEGIRSARWSDAAVDHFQPGGARGFAASGQVAFAVVD